MLTTSSYLRKGIVYMPVMGLVQDGPYLDMEPVWVVPAADSAGLKKALLEQLARGNPKLPHQKTGTQPSVILKYAGVSSWAAFERGVESWDIKKKGDTYEIVGYRKRPDRGLEEDPDRVEKLPAGTDADAVCARMVEIIQAKAQEMAAR